MHLKDIDITDEEYKKILHILKLFNAKRCTIEEI